MPRIARENTSLRLFLAEKTGFKSESDSEGVTALAAAEEEGIRSGVDEEGPNLLIAAFNLLAGDALSVSELASCSAWVRENRSM